MNDVFLFGYLTSKIYCPACVSRMGFGARCPRCFNNGWYRIRNVLWRYI